ncbi:MAG TPA: sigma-70 family RNA polymerase sigma factor [Flavisolibacter sp.]|nr:sigma-70 family RNA polymerase sigma factor [Flavisolibacter sp.]
MSHPIENNSEDKHLVDLVLNGDTAVFGRIIKNTEGLVAQIVFKMIPNAEDRKDIIQDIYMKSYNKLKGFKFQSSLSTWIWQISFNTCLSWLDKKKFVLIDDLYDSGDDKDSAIETLYFNGKIADPNSSEMNLVQKDLASIFRREIDNLSPLYKTLVTLYHQEGLSYDELVLITGLPPGTVKSYLFRARKTLKDNLFSKYKKEAL